MEEIIVIDAEALHAIVLRLGLLVGLTGLIAAGSQIVDDSLQR